MRIDYNANQVAEAELDRMVRDERALDAKMARIAASLPVYPPFVYRESRLRLYGTWITIVGSLAYLAYAFYCMSLLI